jgi:hypothetical protein
MDSEGLSSNAPEDDTAESPPPGDRMLTGAAGMAVLDGGLRGLSSSVPNVYEGGGSVTPARAEMGPAG